MNDNALEQIVKSIQTSTGVNALLWLISTFGGLGVIIWVLVGGPLAEVRTRAEAVERLWPLALTWAASLVGKSKVTSDQKRELIRADSMLRVARLQPGAMVLQTAGGSALMSPPVNGPPEPTASGEGEV